MKRKSGRKKLNAYIYNLAAISYLTSLLFIYVNTPCSPVSLKCSVPLHTVGNAPDHWPCFGEFTWGIVEGWFFFFLPLWRLTVYNDTLDIKWKAQNLNPVLSPFKLRSHRSLTGTSKHWIKQSCQQLGTIINSFCIVSSWVLGFEFYLFKANVNIQCFPQAAPSFLGILDLKGIIHRIQRLICSC